MRKPRRAKLTIESRVEHPPDYDKNHPTLDVYCWLGLRARNGEKLMNSEGYLTKSNAKRSRAAILRAMVDVLTDEGYVVTKAEEAGR